MKHSFYTERLLLTPISTLDKALYCELYGDKKVMRNIGKTLSEKEAINAFNTSYKLMNNKPFSLMTWVIKLKENKNSIGIIALNWKKNNKLSNDTAEIGIMLLRHQNGKQIPEEAMSALISYAFKSLSLNRVNAIFDKKNLATARFTKKIGFYYNENIQPVLPHQRFEFVEKTRWNL